MNIILFYFIVLFYIIIGSLLGFIYLALDKALRADHNWEEIEHPYGMAFMAVLFWPFFLLTSPIVYLGYYAKYHKPSLQTPPPNPPEKQG